MDSLAKFLEIERIVMFSVHKALKPYYPCPHAEFLLLGAKFVVNSNLYKKASIRYPMDVEVSVDYIGKTSLTLSASILDAETGEEMAVAYRRPTLVDMDERVPVKIPKEVYNLVNKDWLLESRQLILPSYKEIMMQKPTMLFSQSVRIRYMDYDLLYHVNHSRYVGFALDCAQLPIGLESCLTSNQMYVVIQ